MPRNDGKAFESRFAMDWKASFKDGLCLRLPDQQSRYKGTSKNPSDFICFADGKFYFVECKSTTGNTFPLSRLTQLKLLEKYKDIKDVHCGVVIWFSDHFKVVYVPIDTFLKMLSDGVKSVNVRSLNSEQYEFYDITEVPSIKLVRFLKSDYSFMKYL